MPPALEHPTTTPTAHPCDVITSSCAHSGVFSALGERVAVAQLQAPPPAASRQDSSMTRPRAGQACLSLHGHGRSYLFCTLAQASLSRQITMKQCVQGPKQRVVTNKEGLHPFAVRWQCSPILRAMCAVQQSFLDATGNTNAADGGGRNASVASLCPPPSASKAPWSACSCRHTWHNSRGIRVSQSRPVQMKDYHLHFIECRDEIHLAQRLHRCPSSID